MTHDVKSDHHPVCATTGAWVNGCICVPLHENDARVRADERERAAERVAAAHECMVYEDEHETFCLFLSHDQNALDVAAVRGGA